MSSSSNITLRPRFKAFTRDNDTIVMINLDLVRYIEATPTGARLVFGIGNDRVEVKHISLDQLQSMMDP